jgi:hypothetical protein
MQNRFIVLALISLTIIFLSSVIKVDFNQVLADATKLTTFSTENRGFIFESRLVPNASINLDLNLGSPFIGLIGGSGSSLGSSINLDINNGTPFISLKGGTAAPNTSINLDLNKSNPFIKLKGGTITANTSLNLGINNDSPFISLKGGQNILNDSSVDIDFNKGSPFIKLYGGISTSYTSINLNLRKDNPFIAIEGGITDPNAIIYLDLNRGSPFIKLNGGGNAPNASIDFDLNRGTPFIRIKSGPGAPMILYSANAAGTPINPAGFLYVIDPPSLGGTYSVLSFFPPQPAGGKEGKVVFQQVIDVSKIDFLPILAKTPTTTSDIHQVATKEYVDNSISDNPYVRCPYYGRVRNGRLYGLTHGWNDEGTGNDMLYCCRKYKTIFIGSGGRSYGTNDDLTFDTIASGGSWSIVYQHNDDPNNKNHYLCDEKGYVASPDTPVQKLEQYLFSVNP